MKNKYILAVLLIALIFGAALLFKEKRAPPKSEGAIFIEKIREENKSGFDSLQNAITSENNLHSLITKNIYTGDFTTAYTLMDSIPIAKRFYFGHFYRGLIYEKQKKLKKQLRSILF